jgi:hypothetical protein
VRRKPAYDYGRYYQHYVLNFLQGQELSNPHSSLVRVLINYRKGTERRVVYKKDLEDHFPRTKDYLFEFSRQNPEVLQKYRSDLELIEKADRSSEVDSDHDEAVLARALAQVLSNIPAGNPHATAYHRLMIGVVEFIFYPKLMHPMKEKEIHEGRKRIDIVMENAAQSGLFHVLPNIRRLPSSYVAFECKNYGREVGNPELDQISGRFSVNRGKVGFLLTCLDFLIHVELRISALRRTRWACDSPGYCAVARCCIPDAS